MRLILITLLMLVLVGWAVGAPTKFGDITANSITVKGELQRNQTLDRYILFPSGSNFVVQGPSGAYIFSSTNLTTAFLNATQSHRKVVMIGTFHPGSPLYIYQKEDIQIELQGTILWLAGYAGYYYHGKSGIVLRDSDNIILRGGTIDGNKANTRTGATIEILGLCNNILMEDMIIKECDQMALGIGGTVGANTNIAVKNIVFQNNTDWLNNPDEDVYIASPGTNILFEGCTFKRDALSLSQSQALYVDNCTGTYIGNYFENIALPYDFRHGTHRVIGTESKTSNFAVSVNSVYDSFPYNPKVEISDSHFYSITPGSSQKCAVGVGFGSLTLRNCLIDGDSSTYALYGVKLGDNYGTNSTNCIVENCVIKGFKDVGIRVIGSTGGHHFNYNEIIGSTTGIGFEMHNPIKHSSASYNNFTGVSTKYSFIEADNVDITDPDNGY